MKKCIPQIVGALFVLVMPSCGREGNYHCLEIPLYYRFLRENIALRIQGIASDDSR